MGLAPTLVRIRSEGEAKEKRIRYRQEKGVNEKNKKFLERVLHLLMLCAIFFVDYQSVRCGVIPLKVLHQFL